MTLSPAHKQSITTVKRGGHETLERPTGDCGHQDARLLLRLHKRLGSWETVADALGKSPAFWWKVAYGKIKKLLSEELRRCLSSSDPRFLRLIQQGAVPWLKGREDKWCCNQ